MKKVFFLTALFGLMLISCKKEIELSGNSDDCILTIYSVLYNTYTPISETSVEVMGLGQVQQTDQSGMVGFKIPPGSYNLKIKKAGYAELIQNINIGNNMNFPYPVNNTYNISMYPLTASLKGAITIERDNEVSYQKGATIKITSYYSGYLPEPYMFTSDENGFTAEKLPAGIPLRVDVTYMEDGMFYGGSSGYSGLILDEGAEQLIPAIRLQTNFNFDADIVVKPKDDRKAPIKITFNMPIDVEKVDRNSIGVSRWNVIGVTYSFTNGNRTLLIYPADMEDGWATDAEYYYNVELYNLYGERKYVSGYFSIGAGIEKIDPVNVTYNKVSQALTWEKAENVEYYDVYVKVKGESDYTVGGYYYNDSDLTTPMNIYLSSFIYSDGEYLIRVIGRKGNSQGDLGEAKTIEVYYTWGSF